MSRALRALVVLFFAFAVAIVLRASLPVVQTGQWVAGPTLSDVRDGAASVLESNGDLLIAGGQNSAGVLQTADLIHADGTVSTAAPMLNARTRHTATLLLDGRILVAGGDSGNGAAINAAEVYDPASDTWTAVGPLGFARFGHTAIRLKDGRVVIAGGENNGTPVPSIEIFDPAADSFSQPANLQTARKDQAAALLADGRILVAGGFRLDAQGNAVALNSVEIFDPSTNAVSATANMNVARGRHSATTVLDGLVVVAGGSDGQADLNSIEIYTPATDTWATSSATLSTARSGHIGILLTNNNSVLISGGTSNGNAVQIAELYQPWTGAIVGGGTTNTPHVLGSGSPFGVEGLYLAAGGSGGSSTEFFRFATIKTDQPDYAPGTPVVMTGGGYQPNETVNLVLSQDDGDPTTTTPVQADAAGNIAYQGFAPDTGDIGTHFHLTAIAQTSGLQAQTVFTDGNVSVSGKVVSSAAGNPPIAGATVTCDTTTGCNAVITTTTDANGNYSFAGGNKLSFAGNGPATLTIKASATGFLTGSITLSNVSNGNTFTNENFTLTPAQAATTLSASPATGTYGGTVTLSATLTVTAGGAPVSGKTISFSLNGSPAGTATTNASGVATLSNASLAGINQGTFATGISASFAGDVAFTASSGTAQLTVNRAGVSTTVTANNKTYDAATTATQNTCTLSGVIPADTGNVTCSASTLTFSDKNVGTGKTVNVSGIALSGSAAGNYQLSSTTGTTTASITARALTVSATGVNKIYDGTTAATVTLSDDRVAGDSLTDSYTSASFADKNVGTGKTVQVTGISISGVDSGNYVLSNTTATATADITQRTLHVTATGVNKIYDGTTTATVTLSDDRVTGDSLTDSYTSATFADKNAGNGKTVSVTGISISGADAGNYSLANTTASTTANITQRPLHVTATGVNKVYDGTTAATVNLADDRIAGDVFTDSYTSATFSDRNVGTGKAISVTGISITGADAGNYSFNTSASATADITARAITVTAASDTKQYDGTTASTGVPTVTVGSIATGDTQNFTQSFDSKNAGPRTLNPAGSVNDGNGGNNYAITFASNTGSIIPRPLTVTATGINKIYDGTTSASVTLSDNHLTGDSVTDSYTAASFSDKNVGNGKPVTVSGISISGTDSGNYSLTNTTASTSANITPRTLTVTAHGQDKQYDGTTAATVTLTDDRVSGDSVTDSYTSASFADKNVGTGKTVSVSGISISGADAGNYSLANTTASTTASINPRGLTVTATAANRVYDGTANASVTLSDNRLAGDVFSDSYTSAAFSDRNAGSGKTVTVSGISISGPDAPNYSLTSTTASTTANIAPLPINVSAVTDSKSYDGTTTSAGVPTVSPALISPDTGIFSQSFNNKNAGTGKTLVPAASITDGNGGNNYAVTLINNNTGVISPRGLLVTATASNKVYDGTTTATVSFSDNRLAGDSFTVNYVSANFSDQNAGNGKTVTVSGISLSGPDAGNYTPNTTAATTANILVRPITVTADTKTKIFGTPDPALTYQITSGSLVAGDTFSGSLARAAGNTVGSYAINQGTLALSSNYALSFVGSTLTITPAATTITVNPAATITLGQTSLAVSATVSAVLPSTATVNEGNVTFTLLQGTTVVSTATSGAVAGGAGTASLAVSTLPVGSYTLQATYNPPATGADFTGSSSATGVGVGVQYNVCLLYDPTKSVKSGATYPVKLFLCDVNSKDFSSSAIVLHATSVSMLSGFSGTPEDAGDANPDLDFRYDSTLGPSGGYIFNLKTTGLGGGTYSLNFTVSGDSSTHGVPFGVK